MGNEIIIAIIGLISTLTSLGIGWFTGRRKNHAEASLMEAGIPLKVSEFYLQALDDLNLRLEYYIALSNENRVKTYELERTVSKLTKLLRNHYSEEDLTTLLYLNEDN